MPLYPDTSKAPRLLAASGVAVSHTGNTNEVALATVTIPGGAMGLNGGLLIYTTWGVPNSANAKTFRVRLGGAAGSEFLSRSETTIVSNAAITRIRNRGSASSQIGGAAPGIGLGLGVSGVAAPVGAINTAVDTSLVISGQLALGSETITLENYEVWLLP